MSLIDHFYGHEEKAAGRLLDQFKNAADLKALAKSYAAQVQDLEDAIFEVILERILELAEGVQLTVLGAIVQQPRTTAIDKDFRTAIRAKIAINLSSGTAEELINLATLILAGETFEIRDEPPAQVRITILDLLTLNPAQIQDLLELADLGGVRLLLNYTTSVVLANQLKYADDAGVSSGTPYGYLYRANVMPNPKAFDLWNMLQVTVDPNVETAPDGTTTADKIEEDATTNPHYIWEDSSPAIGVGELGEFSVYAKRDERSWIYLTHNGPPFTVFFDLSTGAVGSGTGPFVKATITDMGSNWYKCTVFFVGTGNTTYRIGVTTGDVTTSHAGVLGWGVFVWNAWVKGETEIEVDGGKLVSVED